MKTKKLLPGITKETTIKCNDEYEWNTISQFLSDAGYTYRSGASFTSRNKPYGDQASYIWPIEGVYSKTYEDVLERGLSNPIIIPFEKFMELINQVFPKEIFKVGDIVTAKEPYSYNYIIMVTHNRNEKLSNKFTGMFIKVNIENTTDTYVGNVLDTFDQDDFMKIENAEIKLKIKE